MSRLRDELIHGLSECRSFTDFKGKKEIIASKIFLVNVRACL